MKSFLSVTQNPKGNYDVEIASCLKNLTLRGEGEKKQRRMKRDLTETEIREDRTEI